MAEEQKKEQKKEQKQEQKQGKKDYGKWFREMKSELKKIVWPTPQKTLKDTGTVLMFSLIVGACIWIFDYAAYSAVQLLIGLAG